MKLVTHGPDGSERPGIIDAASGIRDLSGKCQDFGPAFFAANDTAALRDVDVETLPKVKAGSRIGPCVAQPGNFIAIGLNYVQHASETKSDVQNLNLWLEVNGERVQSYNTSDMIFSIARIVADTSQYVLLEPGDIITTGTPPGVGVGMKPPRSLKSGDTMRLGIDGLGVQEQLVANWGQQLSNIR